MHFCGNIGIWANTMLCSTNMAIIFCPSAIFGYLGGQAGGGKKSESLQILKLKIKNCKTDKKLIAWNKANYEQYLQIICFSLQKKSLANTAYLHHWLSATIHFNRYNLCFDKYTECRDKCKSLYFNALHIRVVPPLFSPFVECPLSDTRCWMIGHFRMDVTERLLNTKVVVFLGFLWFAVWFLFFEECWMVEKCS